MTVSPHHKASERLPSTKWESSVSYTIERYEASDWPSVESHPHPEKKVYKAYWFDLIPHPHQKKKKKDPLHPHLPVVPRCLETEYAVPLSDSLSLSLVLHALPQSPSLKPRGRPPWNFRFAPLWFINHPWTSWSGYTRLADTAPESRTPELVASRDRRLEAGSCDDHHFSIVCVVCVAVILPSHLSFPCVCVCVSTSSSSSFQIDFVNHVSSWRSWRYTKNQSFHQKCWEN